MEKMMFKGIEGGKKERPPVDYGTIYIDGAGRAMEGAFLDPDNKDYTKRIVYYMIKHFSVVVLEEMWGEKMESFLVLVDMLMDIVCRLTPAELMNIFPIEKIYDGKKYGCKDYFTTMEALQAYDLNEPIKTKEKVESLLWDYMNVTVMEYQVNRMRVIGELYRLHTGKCLVEQDFKKLGFDSSGYKLYRGSDGREVMVDNNGNSFPFKRKIPEYKNFAY